MKKTTKKQATRKSDAKKSTRKELRQVGRSKSFDEIIEQIRENVTSGKWRPGDKLPSERVLCEELGVSRPAMREALRALETIGLVRCNHGEGNYLAQDTSSCLIEPLSIMFSIGGANIAQVQHLRHALERETARLAAMNANPEQVEYLRALCGEMADSTDEDERVRLDRVLHFSIAQYADSPLILSTLNASSTLVDDVIHGIRAMILCDDSGGAIDEQHKQIVEAIAQGDPYLAAKAMDVHMELIEQYVMRSMLAETGNPA